MVSNVSFHPSSNTGTISTNKGSAVRRSNQLHLIETKAGRQFGSDVDEPDIDVEGDEVKLNLADLYTLAANGDKISDEDLAPSTTSPVGENAGCLALITLLASLLGLKL